MADQSQGPGWWLASDGRWYPPDQAPPVPPPETWAAPPAGPPPRPRRANGPLIVLVSVLGALGLVLLGVLVLRSLGGEADDPPSSQAGSPPAPADLPEGYEQLEGEGVSIGAPDTWQEVDPADFRMSDAELAEAFPDVPEGFMEQTAVAFDEGAVLVAFELDSEFSSNVNVGDFPGSAPLGLLETEASAQIEKVGGVVQTSGPVDLPLGEAVHVEYTLDVAGPGGDAITANGVQYYLPLEGRTYVVTITSDDPVTELGATMIETFRVA